jgi:ethanolamine utilization protein EutA
MVTQPLASEQPFDAITFSGGVSEFIYERENRSFGDISGSLSRAIRQRINDGRFPAPIVEGKDHIRATVIGASQFTVQVSGNTVQVSRPDLLPMNNIQVLYPHIPHGDGITADEVQAAIAGSFRRFDLEEGEQPVALTIDWAGTPSYKNLRTLADGIVAGLSKSLANGLPVTLVFQNDVGKLIGYILRDDLAVTGDVVSIDGIDVKEFDFIDIGAMLQPARAVPVVIKSLVFPHGVDPRAELAATV